MTQPAPLTPEQRRQLEQTYAQLCSSVVQLAHMLGKQSPIVTRKERRGTSDDRSERAES